MRKIIFLLGVAGCLVAAGCRSIPFQPAARVPVASVDAEQVLQDYKQTMPESYQLVNSVVFHYYWKTFSALGWLAVNQDDDSFVLSALTPMGVKLFELHGNGPDIRCPYAMEEFTKRGDFASVVGRDIREIYLNLVPGNDAVLSREKYTLVWRDEQSDGKTVAYAFGGPDRLLLKKTGYQNNKKMWTVNYCEYALHDGKWYPRGIFFKHHRYHYSFELRIKEWLDANGGE